MNLGEVLLLHEHLSACSARKYPRAMNSLPRRLGYVLSSSFSFSKQLEKLAKIRYWMRISVKD